MWVAVRLAMRAPAIRSFLRFSSSVAALLAAGAAASLAVGCAPVEDEPVAESNDAISAYESKLVVSQGAWAKVSVSDLRSCAVRLDGTSVCWGARYRNESPPGYPPGTIIPVLAKGGPLELGQATDVVASSTLGGFYDVDRLTGCTRDAASKWTCPRFDRDILPADLVPPPEALSKVVLGSRHQCGIRADKTITCWGRYSNEPAWTPPTGEFRDLAIDDDEACAIRDDDQSLVCWGGRPLQIVPPGAFKQVVGSQLYNLLCGVRVDGSFECGLPTSRVELAVKGDRDDDHGRQLPESMRLDKVSLGAFQACGIRADTKGIFCWGDIRMEPYQQPNGIIALAPTTGKFKDISLSNWHACAIREDDALVCWGDEKAGLGTGRGKPVDVGIFELPQ